MPIKKGKKKGPFNILLYGVRGVGKTTFAEQAPSPIFIGPENFDEIESDAITTKSFKEFKAELKNVIENHSEEYKTIVIDTIDGVEGLIVRELLDQDPKRTGSMMSAYGGYGKAWDKVNQEFETIRDMLISAREEKGFNVILLGHATQGKKDDAIIGAQYDTWATSMYKKSEAFWCDWVPAVLFAAYKMTPKGEVNGSDKMYFETNGDRVMYTQDRGVFGAKNRFGLPAEMPFEFDGFMKGFNNWFDKPSTPEKYIDAINQLLTTISDADLKAKIEAAVEMNKTDKQKLEMIYLKAQDRVRT